MSYEKQMPQSKYSIDAETGFTSLLSPLLKGIEY
jgi:hypothetical protein